jgi:hypothetical protein
MLDLFDIPNLANRIQVFQTSTSGAAWQTWQKPRNCKFVYIYTIGGGGGGAGGQAGTGTNRVGGAGGGSAAITRGYFPAAMIPDTLYVLVGAGGLGGASNGIGIAGSATYVSMYANAAVGNNLIFANNGSNGTLSSVAGGAGGTLFNLNSAYIAGIMTFGSGRGEPGAVGGTNTGGNGGNITPSIFLTGGAGGGGASSAGVSGNGGNILSSGIVQQINGGTAGGIIFGESGYASQIPSINTSTRLQTIFTGGAGGAANATGIGGAGGNGAYGCGGGGGGAGTTGGRGGRGGDGLVIVISF